VLYHHELNVGTYDSVRPDEGFDSGYSFALCNCSSPIVKQGTAVAQWLRYCVTNRKVPGSIPDGVIGLFH
jgi:hypothetical protein